MITEAFIAGTDTEVGKTVITCALLQILVDAGYRAVGMKPVATGAEHTKNGLRNEDAIQLIENSIPKLGYNIINPCVYIEPTSPNIAAAQMDAEVDLVTIDSAYDECRAVADIVLVEGIGGWRVPLSDSIQTVDLVRHLKLPVILVCGIRLGCISHALLTAESILGDNINFLGWVANIIDPGYAFQADSIDVLRKRIPAPLLGVTDRHNPIDNDAVREGLRPGVTRLWP